MRQLLVFGLCVMLCTLWLGLSAVKIVNVVRPGPGLRRSQAQPRRPLDLTFSWSQCYDSLSRVRTHHHRMVTGLIIPMTTLIHTHHD